MGKPLTERSHGTERTIIYGADRTRLALASCFADGNLIGFVDDDPYLKGSRIRGFKVFGHESDISTIHKVHPFENLWVTFYPATGKRVRLEKFCECNNIKLLILPELEPSPRCTPISVESGLEFYFQTFDLKALSHNGC